MRKPKVLLSHTDTLTHTATENSQIDQGAEEVEGLTSNQKTDRVKMKLSEETKLPAQQQPMSLHVAHLDPCHLYLVET